MTLTGHFSVSADTTIRLDGNNLANGIDAWRDWTEYGQPAHPVTTTVGGAAGAGYGWLGAHERATLNTLGIHPHGRTPLQPHHGTVHQPGP